MLSLCVCSDVSCVLTCHVFLVKPPIISDVEDTSSPLLLVLTSIFELVFEMLFVCSWRREPACLRLTLVDGFIVVTGRFKVNTY